MKPKIKTRSKNVTVECLACKDDVYVGQNPKIGNYVFCHSCDAEFQIIDLEPVMIDWPDYNGFSDEDEGYYDDTYDEYDD
jgi:hypothetical protein